ncbi:MAG: methyl-accepting chemotaxis protein, partial [Tissierellia bacterium]|nr:methyl-accepting chemotaxis protein [Tissierellia bacterium]
IQNSSAASEEQMASMEEISSSTEALARLAEELQILINDIKL